MWSILVISFLFIHCNIDNCVAARHRQSLDKVEKHDLQRDRSARYVNGNAKGYALSPSGNKWTKRIPAVKRSESTEDITTSPATATEGFFSSMWKKISGVFGGEVATTAATATTINPGSYSRRVEAVSKRQGKSANVKCQAGSELNANCTAGNKGKRHGAKLKRDMLGGGHEPSGFAPGNFAPAHSKRHLKRNSHFLARSINPKSFAMDFNQVDADQPPKTAHGRQNNPKSTGRPGMTQHAQGDKKKSSQHGHSDHGMTENINSNFRLKKAHGSVAMQHRRGPVKIIKENVKIAPEVANVERDDDYADKVFNDTAEEEMVSQEWDEVLATEPGILDTFLSQFRKKEQSTTTTVVVEITSPVDQRPKLADTRYYKLKKPPYWNAGPPVGKQAYRQGGYQANRNSYFRGPPGFKHSLKIREDKTDSDNDGNHSETVVQSQDNSSEHDNDSIVERSNGTGLTKHRAPGNEPPIIEKPININIIENPENPAPSVLPPAAEIAKEQELGNQVFIDVMTESTAQGSVTAGIINAGSPVGGNVGVQSEVTSHQEVADVSPMVGSLSADQEKNMALPMPALSEKTENQQGSTSQNYFAGVLSMTFDKDDGHETPINAGNANLVSGMGGSVPLKTHEQKSNGQLEATSQLSVSNDLSNAMLKQGMSVNVNDRPANVIQSDLLSPNQAEEAKIPPGQISGMVESNASVSAVENEGMAKNFVQEAPSNIDSSGNGDEFPLEDDGMQQQSESDLKIAVSAPEEHQHGDEDGDNRNEFDSDEDTDALNMDVGSLLHRQKAKNRQKVMKIIKTNPEGNDVVLEEIVDFEKGSSLSQQRDRDSGVEDTHKTVNERAKVIEKLIMEYAKNHPIGNMAVVNPNTGRKVVRPHYKQAKGIHSQPLNGVVYRRQFVVQRPVVQREFNSKESTFTTENSYMDNAASHEGRLHHKDNKTNHENLDRDAQVRSIKLLKSEDPIHDLKTDRSAVSSVVKEPHEHIAATESSHVAANILEHHEKPEPKIGKVITISPQRPSHDGHSDHSHQESEPNTRKDTKRPFQHASHNGHSDHGSMNPKKENLGKAKESSVEPVISNMESKSTGENSRRSPQHPQHPSHNGHSDYESMNPKKENLGKGSPIADKVSEEPVNNHEESKPNTGRGIARPPQHSWHNSHLDHGSIHPEKENLSKGSPIIEESSVDPVSNQVHGLNFRRDESSPARDSSKRNVKRDHGSVASQAHEYVKRQAEGDQAGDSNAADSVGDSTDDVATEDSPPDEAAPDADSDVKPDDANDSAAADTAENTAEAAA